MTGKAKGEAGRKQDSAGETKIAKQNERYLNITSTCAGLRTRE